MKSKLLVLTEDATSLSIEDNSIDLVIAYPPFFSISTDRYGGDFKKQINFSNSSKKMLKLLNKMTKEMIRVLKPGGHFLIANGSVQFVDIKYLIQTIKSKELFYVDSITQSFYDFLKEDDKNNDKVYAETLIQWHHFIKGQDMGYFNPYQLKKYKNPVWNFPSSNIDSEVDKELAKQGYFVFDAVNEDLIEAFISIFSKPNQTVLAPFGGSGVVAVKALSMNRNAISNDISELQKEILYARMNLSELGEYLDK